MASKIKVIRTEEDYEEALALVEELMNKAPDPDSEDGEKLNLLTTLVQDYESKNFPSSLPDPVDAILFRMEQDNLKPSDLVPYIGSRSKVSEVLSRKRPLTISMMRSLEKGLGIPAKVLLQEADQFRDDQVIWSRFPLREMWKRGYFGKIKLKTSESENLLSTFFQSVGSPALTFGMLRKSNYRFSRPVDKHALVAWSTFVIKKANKITFKSDFENGTVSLDFMRQLSHLSAEKNGPLLARDFLKDHGIALVIEPHFPQTYLDGATMSANGKHPIIGLTLRYDRVDNFWFTLMHELAHISLHYDQGANFFYDDLDNTAVNDEREAAADRLAGEALIPEGKWESSPARLVPSPIAAESLARELGIHVAIVAGKMRHENQRYHYLNSIVNEAKVRIYFPEEHWIN